MNLSMKNVKPKSGSCLCVGRIIDHFNSRKKIKIHYHIFSSFLQNILIKLCSRRQDKDSLPDFSHYLSPWYKHVIRLIGSFEPGEALGSSCCPRKDVIIHGKNNPSVKYAGGVKLQIHCPGMEMATSVPLLLLRSHTLVSKAWVVSRWGLPLPIPTA